MTNMTTFTPITATLGGLLIGIAANLLLVLNGRVAGISGIVAGLYPPRAGEFAWRGSFVLGLLVGGLALLMIFPGALQLGHKPSIAMAAVAGTLVGVGTQLGNGCTSGHGVCGISRLSPRSLVATLTFIATGALAVVVVRLVGGAR